MENKESYFRKVIKENKDRIYRICCYYISTDNYRQDLYQEILVNIWKELESFRAESAISTWIYRIAVNTSLLFIYKEKKLKVINEDISKLKVEYIQDEELIKDKIDLEKNINLLLRCINKLPATDKTIISLVLENLSYKEISEITGLTINHIGVKVNRIKKELKKIMEGGGS